MQQDEPTGRTRLAGDTRDERDTAGGSASPDSRPVHDDGPRTYDGFLSYSRTTDSAVAQALQLGLQTFAKPWYRRRALRLFRDDSSLAANPALWDSIRSALDSSRYLILLASPASARSSWVEREVTHWSERNPVDRLMLVVVSGRTPWDPDAPGEAQPALSDRVRALLPGEPRYVDLRWVDDPTQATLREPRFRDAVADLAAPIHHRDKDELTGEDLRQHTRFTRWRNAAVLTLVLLLVASLTATYTAITQRNLAVEQRNTAISRQLGAQADVAGTGGTRADRELAGLLAVAAYRIAPTQEAVRALRRSSLDHTFVTEIPGSGSEDWLFLDETGRRLATVDYVGRVISVWDVPGKELLFRTPPAPAPLHSVVFSADGRHLAFDTGTRRSDIGVYGTPTRYTGDDETIQLWDTDTRSRVVTFDDLPGHVGNIKFSPDGNLLVAALGKVTLEESAFAADGTPAEPGRILAASGEVRIWDVRNPDRPPRVLPGWPSAKDPRLVDPVDLAAFAPDGSRLATVNHYNRDVTIWDVPSGRSTLTFAPAVPAGRFIGGLIMDVDGTVALVLPQRRTEFLPPSDTAPPETVAIQRWDIAANTPKGQFEVAPFVLGTRDDVTGTIAFLGYDGTLRYWDEARSVTALTVPPPNDDMRGVWTSMSGDGGTVVYRRRGNPMVDDDVAGRVVVVSDQRPQRIVAQVCATLGGLTAQQWQTYVGPALPYVDVCA